MVFLEAVNRELSAQFAGSLWSFRGKVKIDTVTQVSVTNSEDRIRVGQLEFPGPETRPKTLTLSAAVWEAAAPLQRGAQGTRGSRRGATHTLQIGDDNVHAQELKQSQTGSRDSD